MDVTYSIIGPGKDENNPIEAFIDCGESAATVCWVGRLSMPVGCVDGCHNEKICSSITLTQASAITSGHTQWNGQNVYYKITSGECITPPSTSCTASCSDLDAYVVPSTIPSGYSTDNVFLYYSYYLTNCDNGELNRIYKSGVLSGVSFSSNTSNTVYKYNYSPEGLGCEKLVEVHVSSGDVCVPGESVYISFSFNPSYVPAEPSSGTDVDVIVTFKRVVFDDECNKKVINGQFPLKWHVECTSGSSDTPSDPDYKYRCCEDHYVVSSITKGEIIEKTGASPNAKIYYNGSEVPDGQCAITEPQNIECGDRPTFEATSNSTEITFSILQKGKTTEECSGLCKNLTTYCVDENSVNIYYEVGGYMSDLWEIDSGCSITAPQDIECGDRPTFEATTKSGGKYKVPSTGGRIKVTWEYSSHTITNDCHEYDMSGGTWEEIIYIGGCDERPTDCESGYSAVTIDGEGHTAPYDEETYNDCEICDSECCYNYDGQGTCRCVILFKEQTPSCTTCDSCDVWDNEAGRTITYNKIRYQFKQECSATCQYFTTYTYDKQSYSAESCDSGITITLDVPYSATTEYIGFGCPESSMETYTAQVSVYIPEPNETNIERVLRDDDIVRVVQKPGPCHEVKDCQCSAITVTDGYELTIDNGVGKELDIHYELTDDCDSSNIISAMTLDDWLSVVSVSDGIIKVRTNSGVCAGSRRTKIVLSVDYITCNDDCVKEIKITQQGEMVIKPDTINCGDTPTFTLE